MVRKMRTSQGERGYGVQSEGRDRICVGMRGYGERREGMGREAKRRAKETKEMNERPSSDSGTFPFSLTITDALSLSLSLHETEVGEIYKWERNRV